VPRRSGYSPCPHHGDRFPCMPGFSTGGSHTHFEPRHFDGPRFSRRCSRPTRLNGEVQRIVKTSSDRMGATLLIFISLTPLLRHQPFLVQCRCWMEAWRTSDSWTPVAHDT
jgi:hypothetical protein